MASRSHQNITSSPTYPLRRALIAGTIAFSLAATLIVSVLYVLPARAFPGSLLPAQGAFLGSWVLPRGSESERDAIRRVESQIGRKFDIDHRYYKWDASIPTAAQQWDVDTGRIPFVNWVAGRTNGGVVPWRSIANGDEDGWIGRRADAFREFGAPIYLTFHHEPEDDTGRWGSPEDFAAAFRHVVEVFRDHGANNVGFVWTLMAWTFDPASGRDVNAFYPGDGYVDFVGADGYNWFPDRPGDGWTTFQMVFDRTQEFAVAHGKPWLAVEYGVLEDPDVPGRKAQWFRDALATAKTWPELKGMIYFDSTKNHAWDTDSSSSSIQAYAEIANDPYLMQQSGGGPSPLLPHPRRHRTPTPPPPPPGDAPPVVKNGLNAGPQGANVQARRGAVAPFDFVSTTRGATLTYDNTHARGAFSAKHVLNDGSDAYYQWNGTRSVWYGRIYVWLDAHPNGDLRLDPRLRRRLPAVLDQHPLIGTDRVRRSRQPMDRTERHRHPDRPVGADGMEGGPAPRPGQDQDLRAGELDPSDGYGDGRTTAGYRRQFRLLPVRALGSQRLLDHVLDRFSGALDP